MRKVLDGIAVLALLISGGIAGVGVYLYLYVTNPVNQDKAKAYVMEQVTGALPELIGGAMPSIPSVTGPAIPPLVGGDADEGVPSDFAVPEKVFPF